MTKILFTLLTLLVGGSLGAGSVYIWKEAEIRSLVESALVLPTTEEDPLSDLVLPQVYIQGSAYYEPEELLALQERIVDPLVTHYEGLGNTVVYISIDSDSLSSPEKDPFIVTCIIAQPDGDQSPGYFGFMVDKVNGEIPMWEPEVAPEGYRG